MPSQKKKICKVFVIYFHHTEIYQHSLCITNKINCNLDEIYYNLTLESKS